MNKFVEDLVESVKKEIIFTKEMILNSIILDMIIMINWTN